MGQTPRPIADSSGVERSPSLVSQSIPHVPAGWTSAAPPDVGQSGSPGAWALVWTIVVVKVITILVTIAIARSWDAGAIMALTTWPWVLVCGALVAGPLLVRYRLRRARARRAQLIREEWLIGVDSAVADPRL